MVSSEIKKIFLRTLFFPIIFSLLSCDNNPTSGGTKLEEFRFEYNVETKSDSVLCKARFGRGNYGQLGWLKLTDGDAISCNGQKMTSNGDVTVIHYYEYTAEIPKNINGNYHLQLKLGGTLHDLSTQDPGEVVLRNPIPESYLNRNEEIDFKWAPSTISSSAIFMHFYWENSNSTNNPIPFPVELSQTPEKGLLHVPASQMNFPLNIDQVKLSVKRFVGCTSNQQSAFPIGRCQLFRTQDFHYFLNK